jgi:drug/metabolite transporter (DMT)-like permease
MANVATPISDSTESAQYSRSEWAAYGCLAAAVVGTSWSAVFVHWAGAPGLVSGFYRVFIAGAVLGPSWIVRETLRNGRVATPIGSGLNRTGASLAFAGGVFFACDLALYHTAILQTQAATAVLLANVAPVFVGLVSWLWFRRRLKGSFWAGLFLALAGCAIITLSDVSRSAAKMTSSVSGDLLAMGASVFWAAYLLTTERIRTRLDTLTFNTFAMLGSSTALFLACVAMRQPLWGYPPRSWLMFALLGLLSQFGAYMALTYALGHLPATIVSVGLLCQIPLTALLAKPLLGEPISVPELFGGAFVIGGMFVVKRQK